ncbi:hypothetical protein NDU88_005938 [Pleurodeles waltl]|uniref:Uncharacterized protein n=1 Tax=Pleurodeles waltl TaxID=8319 RepID=A0AAV7LP63_PLEWA|nr:hypothetical protein NDU88_005938 [Pleurodeles waltl]
MRCTPLGSLPQRPGNISPPRCVTNQIISLVHSHGPWTSKTAICNALPSSINKAPRAVGPKTRAEGHVAGARAKQACAPRKILTVLRSSEDPDDSEAAKNPKPAATEESEDAKS